MDQKRRFLLFYEKEIYVPPSPRSGFTCSVTRKSQASFQKNKRVSASSDGSLCNCSVLLLITPNCWTHGALGTLH